MTKTNLSILRHSWYWRVLTVLESIALGDEHAGRIIEAANVYGQGAVMKRWVRSGGHATGTWRILVVFLGQAWRGLDCGLWGS